MKVLVFGAGAVGSTFGGFLSRSHDVTLLGRRSHLEAIKKNGLRISGIWGNHHFTKFSFATDFKNLLKEEFDLILVTVKSYDTESAARMIRKIIRPQTLVISLQNGLGNVEALQRHLPSKQILAGRVIFGAILSSPGNIKITVMAEPTAIGETTVRKETPRVRKIAKLINDARVPTVSCPDVFKLLWAKVIYNCALNSLASLLNCHYGKLTEQMETRTVMNKVIDEIYEVAAKAKVGLNPPTAAQYRNLFYSKLVARTYDHRPSMLQDLKKGKRTEIDALNGAIVALGKKYEVKTPVNAELTKLIKTRERM